MDLDARPIEVAKDKTGKVKEELAIAGAELHLTHTMIGRGLVRNRPHEVEKALVHSEVVEERVNQAAEDLGEVKELLDQEVEQRKELERELARRPR